jgi:hypothetical protein
MDVALKRVVRFRQSVRGGAEIVGPVRQLLHGIQPSRTSYVWKRYDETLSPACEMAGLILADLLVKSQADAIRRFDSVPSRRVARLSNNMRYVGALCRPLAISID